MRYNIGYSENKIHAIEVHDEFHEIMSAVLNILCVEDEDDIRAIIEIALELSGGFNVKFATTGQKSLRTLEDDAWTPDIALIDILMPDMTGTDLMAILHKRLPGLAVILMTASLWAKNPSRYLAAGAIGVIEKPFDPMTLGQTLLDYWSRSTR
jgi:two-component system OmpR family response regulator